MHKKIHRKLILKNSHQAHNSKDPDMEVGLVMEESQMDQQMMLTKHKKTYIIKIFQKKMTNRFKIHKYYQFILIIISLKENKYLCIMINFQEQLKTNKILQKCFKKDFSIKLSLFHLM